MKFSFIIQLMHKRKLNRSGLERESIIQFDEFIKLQIHRHNYYQN